MTAFIERTPYDDQVEAIANIRAAFKRNRRVCFRAPTGFGKTFVFTYIARRLAERDIRLGIMVHRQELVQQIRDALGVPHGVIMNGWKPDPRQPIQVASVQTLARRLDEYDFDWLIWDECHHNPAAEYQRIQTRYSRSRHLGLTATPFRLDGLGLRDCFDTLVCGPTVPELIAKGRLCKGIAFSHENIISREGIRRNKSGELNQHQLAERAMDKCLIGDMVAHYRQRCDHAPAVLFAVDREHSKLCAKAFCDAGYRFLHVDATTPADERKAAFQGLKSGAVDGVCNVDLVSEGFDVPHLVAVIDAQPTESLARHIQKIGRGARVSQGKDVFYYLDHAGNINRHLYAPDMDLDGFTLDGAPKTRIAAGEKDATVTQCPQCYRAFVGRGECPYCGFVPVAKARVIKHLAGDLVRVDAAQIEAERKKQRARELKGLSSAEGLEKLLKIAVDRGYQQGWVVHQILIRRKHRRDWGGAAADAFIARHRAANAGAETTDAQEAA